ncbi:MAG TPA: serine protease [Elusimicrobia bacterium]|nr:serine protease [Elusimicrobiota bacterium]
MKSALKAIFGLTVIIPILPLLSFAEKSVYGDDNRMDFFSVPADIQKLSDSVVSFWDTKKAVFDPLSKTFTLTTEKFGDKLNLCPEEKFREQPIGAFCSGSLVGADLVITAGHCLADQIKCDNTKLIFGYAVKKEGGQAPTRITEKEVYNCRKIVKRFQGAEPVDISSASASGLGPDYALIQLDRKVKGHQALTINRKKDLKRGDSILVIGHPVGLPLKVSGGATVRDTAPAGYFVTDLDTFGGNSGSPVFNAKTKLVEGILVRGDEDFMQSPAGCTTMATYSQSGGRGEDVTKISELQTAIPKLTAEKKAEAVLAAGTIKALTIGDITALRVFGEGAISFQ